MSKYEVQQTIAALSDDSVPDIFELAYLGLCLDPDREFTQVIVKQKGAAWLHERLEHKFTIWMPHYFEGIDSGKFTFSDDPNSGMAIIIRKALKTFPDLESLVPQRYSGPISRII